MRIIIFVAAAFLLSGCETGDGWVPGENPDTAPIATPYVAPVAVRVAPPAAMPVAPPMPVVAATPVVPPPRAAPAAEVAAAAGPYDEHCRTVAHQRATDARANGYSFDMADAIYDGTFRDCVTWDMQHGAGVSR